MQLQTTLAVFGGPQSAVTGSIDAPLMSASPLMISIDGELYQASFVLGAQVANNACTLQGSVIQVL